jgi:electron transport complex protein RnfB
LNWSRIIYAFVSVGGLGLLFGAGLAVASMVLAVRKNEMLARLEEALPGLNCGACG